MVNPDSSPDFRPHEAMSLDLDLEALTTVLQRSLVHKAIDVQVTRDRQTLFISLQSVETPDQRVSVMLICRTLIPYLSIPDGLGTLTTLSITGQAIPLMNGFWELDLSILDVPDQPTVRQAAQGLLWPKPNRNRSDHASAVQARPDQIRPDQTRPDQTRPAQMISNPTGWRAIAIGAMLVVGVFCVPFLTFVLSPLLIMVHELGHTATNWIFGYPAIPALDFMFGGGITLQSEQRVPLIVGLIYAGFGFLLYRYWQHVALSRIFLAMAIAYTLCITTPLQNFLIVTMGHGFELIFAGIFLHRAVSGAACRNALERPIYALLGLYFVIYNLRFSWGLLFNEEQRAIYEQGKGDILDHDLVRVARDYLHLPLSMVVVIMLVCTLLTPAIVLWMDRSQLSSSRNG